VFVGNILFTGIDPFLEVHHKQTSYSWFLPQIHQAIFSFEKRPMETLQEFEQINAIPWHDEGYFFWYQEILKFHPHLNHVCL